MRKIRITPPRKDTKEVHVSQEGDVENPGTSTVICAPHNQKLGVFGFMVFGFMVFWFYGFLVFGFLIL